MITEANRTTVYATLIVWARGGGTREGNIQRRGRQLRNTDVVQQQAIRRRVRARVKKTMYLNGEKYVGLKNSRSEE